MAVSETQLIETGEKRDGRAEKRAEKRRQKKGVKAEKRGQALHITINDFSWESRVG